MKPRFSARRLLLVIAVFGAVTFWVTLQRPWTSVAHKLFPLKEQHEHELLHQTHNAETESENRNAQKSTDQDKKKYADEEERNKGKNWYFKGGTVFPTKSTKGHTRQKLFPDQDSGDRVVEQLMYVPEDYQGFDSPEKVVLAYNGLGTWGQQSGTLAFHGCPVSRCTLTDDRSRATDADAVLYKDHFAHTGVTRPAKQVWILYFLECPYHTQSIRYGDLVNWTATYRRDSDLVAPYERWTYYDDAVRQKDQGIDYAANKTKKVAWFVSNCGARNGRLAYARELAKHIPVDIYGSCGPLKCPRTDKKCFELLERDYKFYLAFENSNCQDYITEKFYVNGLGQNTLPIVMGARPEDYQRSAPEGSYIHVDEFADPAELAAYLHRLDADRELYNSYFKWKGTGEFINTFFWCRLCAMLHGPVGHRHYEDVNNWWRGPGVCTTKSWRSATDNAPDEQDNNN